MALHSKSHPEPMNSTPHHSKIKVSVTLSDPFYIAGNAITGKMELESRTDKGLGLGIIMVELVAIEELTSRDHSATSTFLHTRRLFQGPSLPPSNAVLPNPVAGEPPLPTHYHPARRGLTTFLFRFPLPDASPSSIDFGNGLARIRYDVRASVAVAWKDQIRLVTDKSPVDVLQRYLGDDATRLGDDGLDFDRWAAPEGLIVGEGGKIWVQAQVIGGKLVAGESACIELQVKNHSTKRTTSLHVTLSRHLHLPAPAGSTDKKLPPLLQISDTLASIAFRGPDYISHPGTEGIARLVFDVPRTARTVSAYPRHGGDVDVDEDESAVLRRKAAPLFEVRGVLAVRVAMPVGSKDIVLELPVAVYHPSTLPPPPPEPYPYPAPDLYSDPYPNYSSSVSPPPPGHSPILYADRTLSPLYAYPSPSPAPPLLPQSIPAPLNTQLVIPPYKAHDGQLWFPSPPPIYLGGPYYNLPPPPRPVSANIDAAQPSIPSAGLPVSGTPNYLHSHRQQQPYPLPPEQTTGHGARAARISHHLRATSRGRSASPSAQVHPPSPAGVDIVAPKPMPSPKVITETHTATDNDDPFARSFGRVGTRTRCLSVVRLEEMAARAAAEAEAKARPAEKEGRDAGVDKTLPPPPVPSGNLSDHGGVSRRVMAQEIFHRRGEPEQQVRGEGEAVNGAETAPRTPSLSALSLLRPPPRRSSVPYGYGERGIEESGLDALERRLAEQVGTRKQQPASPPSDVRAPDLLFAGPMSTSISSRVPPPRPVPAPVFVPGKSTSMIQEPADDLDDLDDVVGAGAAVNESAISSLALGAEEDFGGRNKAAKVNDRTSASSLPVVHGEADATEEDAEGEDADADADVDVDADADGRTQRQGKGGAGASSSSERGTYKARSRKSAKSDSREKEERKVVNKKKNKRDNKREAKDDEAARLRRAAKGRVAEWLGKLEVPVYEPGLDQDREQDVRTPDPAVLGPATVPSIEPERTRAPEEAAASANANPPAPTPVIESEPNPRSSGFIPVSTLRRAPISLNLPAESASAAAAAPVRQRRYPPPPPPSAPQVEAKYGVKSVRGGRGGRVTAVAAIWAEAAAAKGKGVAAGADSISPGPSSGAATPTPMPTPKPKPREAKVAAAARLTKGNAVHAAAKVAAAGAGAGAPTHQPPPPPLRAVATSTPLIKPLTPALVNKHPRTGAAVAIVREKESVNAPLLRTPRALFGLGTAAAATPSSPALSSSIATPVLSSTASLARPSPLTTSSTAAPLSPPMRYHNNPSPSSSPRRSPPQFQPRPPPQSQSQPPSQPPQPTAGAAGQRSPLVNGSGGGGGGGGGGGFKAEFAFGQARLRDLIKRYQGQMS